MPGTAEGGVSSERIRLRSEQVAWREVEGEIVALDVGRSLYLSANRTGALLWPALAAGTTRDELVATLTAAFELDAATAGADVDAFVDALRREELLEQA
jgi:hypothetical protein